MKPSVKLILQLLFLLSWQLKTRNQMSKNGSILPSVKQNDPDPSVISIISVIHGDIPLTSLPTTVKNIVLLKTDDPQFKIKIQKSIFYDEK